jgi:hypothetical protein
MAKQRNEQSLEEMQARNLVTLLGEDVRQACASPLPPEVQARWVANLTVILREHTRNAVEDAREDATSVSPGATAPPTLDQALRDLITEARSRDGVSGRAVRAAIAAADHAESQVAAVRRIVSELQDNGITRAGLAAAEATLRAERH